MTMTVTVTLLYVLINYQNSSGAYFHGRDIAFFPLPLRHGRRDHLMITVTARAGANLQPEQTIGDDDE